jgi:protocatechuate 3,4-dioxygenase beta subunit
MATIDRRRMMALGALAGAGAPLAAAAAQSAAAGAGPRPTLTPPVTEGPYYLPGAPERADIAEDLPGLPVELVFQVLDEAGAPLHGGRLDIWHCDAKGRYSGFGLRPGEAPDAELKAARFLRGTQPLDGAGRAVFHTVYPGWYEGRTTHIHYKVWRGGRTLLTAQVFLPDALNEFLYTQSAEYRRAGSRDTLNRNDDIARQGGEGALGAVAEADDRFRVQFTAVVDRAHPAAEMGPPGFPGGPGHPPPFGPPPEGFTPPAGVHPPGREGPPPFGPPHRDALTGDARLAALLPPSRKASAAAHPVTGAGG